MPYDEELAERIGGVLAGRDGVTEQKMFGGVCFMVGGNMAAGVVGEDLMLRVSPEDAEKALATEHVRPMDFTGKPMKGMVYVSPEGTETDDELAEWVDLGADYAASLPPKKKKKKPKEKRKVRRL